MIKHSQFAGANFTAGGRELFARRSREAGDSVLVKTERKLYASRSAVQLSDVSVLPSSSLVILFKIGTRKIDILCGCEMATMPRDFDR